jgi:hypothetical protein
MRAIDLGIAGENYSLFSSGSQQVGTSPTPTPVSVDYSYMSSSDEEVYSFTSSDDEDARVDQEDDDDYVAKPAPRKRERTAKTSKSEALNPSHPPPSSLVPAAAANVVTSTARPTLEGKPPQRRRKIVESDSQSTDEASALLLPESTVKLVETSSGRRRKLPQPWSPSDTSSSSQQTVLPLPQKAPIAKVPARRTTGKVPARRGRPPKNVAIPTTGPQHPTPSAVLPTREPVQQPLPPPVVAPVDQNMPTRSEFESLEKQVGNSQATARQISEQLDRFDSQLQSWVSRFLGQQDKIQQLDKERTGLKSDWSGASQKLSDMTAKVQAISESLETQKISGGRQEYTLSSLAKRCQELERVSQQLQAIMLRLAAQDKKMLQIEQEVQQVWRDKFSKQAQELHKLEQTTKMTEENLNKRIKAQDAGIEKLAFLVRQMEAQLSTQKDSMSFQGEKIRKLETASTESSSRLELDSKAKHRILQLEQEVTNIKTALTSAILSGLGTTQVAQGFPANSFGIRPHQPNSWGYN